MLRGACNEDIGDMSQLLLWWRCSTTRNESSMMGTTLSCMLTLDVSQKKHPWRARGHWCESHVVLQLTDCGICECVLCVARWFQTRDMVRKPFGQRCRVCILTPHANVSNGGGTLCGWGSLSIPGVCPAIVSTITLVDKSILRSHASMVSHSNLMVRGVARNSHVARYI